MKETADISITIGLLEAEIDSLKDAYKNCKFSALKREYSTQLVSHKQALKMLKQAAALEPLINQEVEKRIKERIGSVESINYLLLDTALKCPHCGGDGFTVVPNYYTGEPEQEQCRWCWELEHYRSHLTCSEKPNNSQKTEGGAK